MQLKSKTATFSILLYLVLLLTTNVF